MKIPFEYLSPSTCEAIYEDLLEIYHNVEPNSTETTQTTIRPILHGLKKYYKSLLGEQIDQVLLQADLKTSPQTQEAKKEAHHYYLTPLKSEEE